MGWRVRCEGRRQREADRESGVCCHPSCRGRWHDAVARIVATAIMVVGEFRGDADGGVGVDVHQRQSDGGLSRAVCFEPIAQREACSSERYTGHVGGVVLHIFMSIRSV
jgi:hypothetical protein